MRSTVLLDTRPGGAWAQGHFEGALDADLERYLSSALEPGFDPVPLGRNPLPSVEKFCRQLGVWGIGPETTVVAYDGARGDHGACRLWWMLKALGHQHVDILHGGIPQGRKQGWVWTTDPGAAPEPVVPYPADQWSWPMVDIDEAEAFALDPKKALIDVRSPERWRGEVETMDPVAGRIPGSTNLPLSLNFDDQGFFRSAPELAAAYAAFFEGQDPRGVAVHCGSGVSACATLYAFDRMGIEGAALYVGSFSQWCRSGRPLGRG